MTSGRIPKRAGPHQSMSGSVHYLVAERNKMIALWLQADFDRFKLLRRIARAEEAGRRPSQASKTTLAGLVSRMRDIQDKLNLINAAYQALVDPDGVKQESEVERRMRGPPDHVARPHRDWHY